VGSSPSGFPSKILCTFFNSSMRVTCTTHLILLDFIIVIILGRVQMSSSSLCSLVQSLITSFVLGQYIFRRIRSLFESGRIRTVEVEVFWTVTLCGRIPTFQWSMLPPSLGWIWRTLPQHYTKSQGRRTRTFTTVKTKNLAVEPLNCSSACLCSVRQDWISLHWYHWSDIKIYLQNDPC